MSKSSQPVLSKEMAIEQESLSRHERASAFLSAFTLAKTRLEQAVAQCKPGYDLGVLEDDVMGLQKMVTDAAGYLPSANLRGVQEDLKRIRADVAATRERLAPRKRFAFKTRAHLGDSTRSVSSWFSNKIGVPKILKRNAPLNVAASNQKWVV